MLVTLDGGFDAGRTYELSYTAANAPVSGLGFVAVRDKPLRLEIQGAGARFRQNFTRAWAPDEVREGHLVVIGRTGMDRAGIETLIVG